MSLKSFLPYSYSEYILILHLWEKLINPKCTTLHLLLSNFIIFNSDYFSIFYHQSEFFPNNLVSDIFVIFCEDNV